MDRRASSRAVQGALGRGHQRRVKGREQQYAVGKRTDQQIGE
jgi:hypothetical protein